MLYKTKGIFFHQIKYSENSVIVKIYTELLGLESYIIKNSHSKKSSVKANILQPLALLDIVAYRREKNALQHIKELHSSHPQSSIPFDIHKSTIALFVNEILYKSIREEEPNKELFDFIYHTIQILDLKENNFNNFHLLFLVKLSKYLGFAPQENYSDQTVFFDLQSGFFKSHRPEHFYFIPPPLSKIFNQLITLNFEQMDELKISSIIRRELLHLLIMYFELHIVKFRDIKSHHIMETLFTD